MILKRASIESLLLSNNGLSGKQVVELLSLLDQGHHYELAHLDLSLNALDQSVVEQLLHMAPRFARLQRLSLRQEPPLQLSALRAALRKTKIE